MLAAATFGIDPTQSLSILQTLSDLSPSRTSTFGTASGAWLVGQGQFRRTRRGPAVDQIKNFWCSARFPSDTVRAALHQALKLRRKPLNDIVRRRTLRSSSISATIAVSDRTSSCSTTSSTARTPPRRSSTFKFRRPAARPRLLCCAHAHDQRPRPDGRLTAGQPGGSPLRSAGPCRALLEDHVQRRGLPRSITTGGGRTSRCSTAPPASAPQPPPDNVARFAGVTGLLVSGVAAQPTRTSTVLRLPYVNVQRCCLLTHEELRGQARCSAAPPAPALHGRLGQRARFAL